MNEEDLIHLDNAIFYQKKGIIEFKENNDIYDYIFYLDKAYDEYKKIDI